MEKILHLLCAAFGMEAWLGMFKKNKMVRSEASRQYYLS